MNPRASDCAALREVCKRLGVKHEARFGDIKKAVLAHPLVTGRERMLLVCAGRKFIERWNDEVRRD